MFMEIKNVAVIGAGAMGLGIAQVSAQAGYHVKLNDISEGGLEKAIKAITKSLDKMVEKEKFSAEEKTNILNRIKTTTNLSEAVSDADLVIEAVFENLNVKVEVFKTIDKIAPEHAIFGSNTSTIPIASMAGATTRQDRFVGLHFMNPVPLMKGVELIRGRHTSDETMQLSLDFVEKLGKEAAVAVDYAGFIVSRILDAMGNEAVKCVMDGNDPAEIDKAMKICCNFPMGPLELIDLVGADIAFNGLETMKQDFGDKYTPAPLLKQMVRSGDLGRKTGRGFYKY
jgi:3-hydroxybutyryl-CoA dehydrogenase